VPEDFRAPIASDVDALRKVLDIDAASPVIVGVFRLSEEKNPLGFIDICDRVRRAIPGLRVFVAGIGPMQREVEDRISALGLESVVSLLGRRNDVPELLSVATLLLLASNFEGMPNVVMEAQLMGVPVVATRTGGTPDIVIDGRTGYLADAGDIDGLARFCIALLRDGMNATAMGHAGRERMRSFFSRDLMIERYLALAVEPRRQSQASVATCSPS
jgi:glycosyltransferase involved in cell wall biosynthesis